MIQLIGYVIFTALILFVAKTYLDKKGHPKALFYLFFAEMWERFSFYGMRALLTLYLIKDFYQDLQNNEEIAYGIYAAYGALVYLTPLLGGYLADKYIGYRKSILFGGILMALGHFFMAFPTEFMFYGALGLLIMGNGFFKPNISTLVGSLYEEGDIKRDGGFTIFYMGINLGGMLGPMICGALAKNNNFGWHYGFAFAGIGMSLGIFQFYKTKHYLGDAGLKNNLPSAQKNGVKICLGVLLLALIIISRFDFSTIDFTKISRITTYLILITSICFFIYVLYFAWLTKVEFKRVLVILVLFL